MKINLKKVTAIFAMMLFFITSQGADVVYAIGRPTNNVSWNFKINAIGDVKRQYHSDNTFNYLQNNMKKIKFSEKTYDINTKRSCNTN
ncbi:MULTISPECIES: hypothetical protein [Clostridium]|uniref:hypothetical protein n=1 Tax=Clostridium TaxID=1485 RepID=UPI00207A6B2A|nr:MULTISPECIES: hypothetical protein [Clostridium]